MGKLTVDYIQYKQQLLKKLDAIYKEIVTLEAEGKELDRQLEAQCQQIQQAIDSGKDRIKSLKAENRAKRKTLELKDEQISNFNYDCESTKANLNYSKKSKIQSRGEKEWILAYQYSCINTNTPALNKNNLNDWVKKVAKECAEKIRRLNHHIIEGNLHEIEKITGFVTVEEVFAYVSKLVNDIRELAMFFNVMGEIRAVYSAFNLIAEDCRANGFNQNHNKSQRNHSQNRHRQNYQNPNTRKLSKKDFPVFQECTSIKEGKELRKKLSIANHPDCGGSEEEMKQINHQFDLFIQWIEQQPVY